MGRGILKAGLSAISSKAPKSVKFIIDNIDPEKVIKYAYSGVRKGAKFINRNWRGKNGSFLIETRGRMRSGPGQTMIPYKASGKKRNRSRVRTKSGSVYKRLKSAQSRSRSSSSAAIAVRSDTTKRGYAAKGKRYVYKSYGRRKVALFNRAVKRAIQGMNDTFIDRRVGSTQVSFAENQRSDLTMRIKDWCFDSVSKFKDFYCTNTAAATGGFLERMPVTGKFAAALPAATDNLETGQGGFNRWTKGSDVDVVIKIPKCRLTCVYRNNSQYEVKLSMYVLRASQDIPANGPSGASAYKPGDLWSAYLIGASSGAALTSGNSNLAITAANVVATHPEAFPSDGRTAWRGWYTVVSHRNVTLFPGDEVKQFCGDPSRTLSLENLYNRFARDTNGLYMLKGDCICYVVAHGGIGHDALNGSLTGIIGLTTDYVDVVHWRETHGKLYQSIGKKFYNFTNGLATISAGNSTQWGVGVSRQT